MSLQQNTLPEWLTEHYFIKKFKGGVRNSCAVRMNDYLVALVHHCELDQNANSKSPYKEVTTLFAVDLRDDSVQQVKIDDDRFVNHGNYTLHKYQDDQIIKFGGQVNTKKIDKIDWITIESFQRKHLKISISNQE